jgi:hypothetical protein
MKAGVFAEASIFQTTFLHRGSYHIKARKQIYHFDSTIVRYKVDFHALKHFGRCLYPINFKENLQFCNILQSTNVSGRGRDFFCETAPKSVAFTSAYHQILGCVYALIMKQLASMDRKALYCHERLFLE